MGILQARILEWVHVLLQGIFPTQGLNPGLPFCRQILYQMSHWGRPRILEWVAYLFSRGSSKPGNRTGVSCVAGGFFTNRAMRVSQGPAQMPPSAWVVSHQPPSEGPTCVALWQSCFGHFDDSSSGISWSIMTFSTSSAVPGAELEQRYKENQRSNVTTGSGSHTDIHDS